MCLAVPGKIIEITVEDPMIRTGRVSFGGIIKEINLSFVPDAVVNDYEIVHVGFALNKIDEEEARKVFEYLKEMGEMDGELEEKT
jgi:hydrogenase expression/formation protein HypC